MSVSELSWKDVALEMAGRSLLRNLKTENNVLNVNLDQAVGAIVYSVEKDGVAGFNEKAWNTFKTYVKDGRVAQARYRRFMREIEPLLAGLYLSCEVDLHGGKEAGS